MEILKNIFAPFKGNIDIFKNFLYIYIKTKLMTTLTFEDKQKICEEYKSSTIEDLSRKFKISNSRVKTILKENGVEIKNPFASQNEMSYDNFAAKRFPHVDGFHYVAKSKKDGTIIKDYLNKGGFLSQYLKRTYGMIAPPTYARMQYMKTHNELWQEQWFDIILEKDQVVPTKKCPYCNWETVDVSNKSGMFLTHILKEHGITKEEHLKSHPEDREYLALANKTLDRQFETDSKKFVTCAICGKKLARIDWRHLNTHSISQYEYTTLYTGSTISNDLKTRLSENMIEVNKTMEPVFESKPEKELKEMIQSCGLECHKEKALFDGMEIDIFVPEKMIGIEYDGVRYHTEWFGKKNRWYHLNKTMKCREKGVKLIHIFEDEYKHKREIVENKVKHILGVQQNLPKIMGRKCEVREISKPVAQKFLDEYHIQGADNSSVQIGAFNGEHLLAVMSFKTEKDNNWELTRFASDYHYICQGIGGRLFKHFVKKFNPSKIKSFADRRWTIDEEHNVYIQMGFAFDGYVNPDYRYVLPNANNCERHHKFGFRKTILHNKYGFPLDMTETQMVKKLKYDRIWDCGLIRYVWKKENGEQ